MLSIGKSGSVSVVEFDEVDDLSDKSGGNGCSDQVDHAIRDDWEDRVMARWVG